ncbi:glycosyltransferase family 4 protein [Desulfothermus naphthae]
MKNTNLLKVPLKRDISGITCQLVSKKVSTSTTLNICFLSYRSNPFCGGQGVYVKYLTKALRELGHRVDVISGEPYPKLFQGVRLIPLPGMNLYGYEKIWSAIKERKIKNLIDLYEVFSYYSGGFPEPLAFSLRAANLLLKKMKTKYHIIHDNQCLSYGLLPIKKKFPLVATIHHPITRDLRFALGHEKNFFMKILIKRWHSFLSMQMRMARRISHIVTVSESAKKDIHRDFKIDLEKIYVVYNGVDFERFRPLPHIKKEPFLIITTASADVPLKGLNYLIEAISIVKKAIPQTKLTVIGKFKKGGLTEKIIRDHCLENRIKFISGLDEVQLVEEYARASLVVAPSLYEGFGFPAAEAMACGKPIISTTGGALKEIVGDAGILVPPADSKAIARAIIYAFNNPQKMEVLGKKARKRIIENFNWNQAAKKTVEVYQEALSTYVNS